MRWVVLLVPMIAQPVFAQSAIAQQATSSPPGSSLSAPAGQSAPAPDRQVMAGMDQGETSGFPVMQFRGFSDVSYRIDNPNGTTNTFSLGQFNLFITSKVSDRFGVLAEVVAEADQFNTVGVDLERMLFRWTVSDYLNVSLGRYHTAIGWYNTAYHHSAWMQTAIGRPFLFEFEDKGGILPIHNVGVSLTGRIPSGDLGLKYTAEIGNGRASHSATAESVQNVIDENSGKAVNLAIVSRPARFPGFEGGASVYYDKLTPTDMPKIGQTIFAFHAIYQTSEFEWLNEAVFIRNATDGTSRVMTTKAFYSQVSKKFGALRPFVRYQSVNVPDGDLMFPDVGLQRGPSIGVRYDLGEFVAFKIQYDRTERRRLSGYNTIATQLSFTF